MTLAAQLSVAPECRGPDGERLGEILINDFREQFSCYLADAATNEFKMIWQAELSALVGGGQVAVLRDGPRFAWIVYREGDKCLVQQRLSLDGAFRGLLPYRLKDDDGNTVSTWATSVVAIQRFLEGTHP